MYFECPICVSDAFDRVVVFRSDGSRYETDFCFCLGCSIMFFDPICLTGAREVRERILAERAEPEPNLAHKKSLRRQWLAAQFFENKVKSRRGGYATRAEVKSLREKWGR